MVACSKRKAMNKIRMCGPKGKRHGRHWQSKVNAEMTRSQIWWYKSEIYANTTVINLSYESENARVFLFTITTRLLQLRFARKDAWLHNRSQLSATSINMPLSRLFVCHTSIAHNWRSVHGQRLYSNNNNTQKSSVIGKFRSILNIWVSPVIGHHLAIKW